MVKGFVNTVEAVLGALIIMSVMIYLFPQQAIQEQSMHDITYNCLKYAKDYSDLDAKLKECIPISYKYQYKICSSSDCSTTLPEGTVTSADYITENSLVRVWVYK
ncbi:MAG: hypothetical protein PHU12_02485 [Candidatus Aenigmarchaeota archaeon]|nr:hypothetical protein [Candidatus Aenigmarchaeota archaeon]